MLAILINVIWLPIAMVMAALLGFIVRSKQLKKNKKQISSLEKEMMSSHAEILSLQKEIVALQVNLQQSKTPVVSMKDASAPEDKNNDNPDPLRKKSLGK